MRKLPLLLSLLLPIQIFAQTTTATPNIGLQIPAYGSNNWQIPLNFNFNRLDMMLSGKMAVPALTVTGTFSAPNISLTASQIANGLGYSPLNPTNNLSELSNKAAALANLGGVGASSITGVWSNTFVYSPGQIATFGGNSYISRVTGNQGNEPDISPTQWTLFSAVSTFTGGTVPNAITAPSFATSGLGGSIALNGSASGTSTIVAPAVAGAATITLPYSTGNLIETVSGLTPGTLAGSSSATGIKSIPIYYVDLFPSTCTINSVAYTTQLDCAWYTAAANNNPIGGIVQGEYAAGTTACLAEPLTGGQISLKGLSSSGNGFPTRFFSSGCTGAMIQHGVLPTGTSLPYGAVFENFELDCNHVASAAWELYAEQEGHASHISYRACTSTDHWFKVGNDQPGSGNQDGSYQFHYTDITGNQNTSPTSNWAQFTVTGTTPVFTQVRAGSYRNPNPPVIITGAANGGPNPCATPGVSTAVMSGTGPYTVTGITSTATGCPPGTYYVVIPDIEPVANMFVEGYDTDSTFTDIVTYGGTQAGITAVHGGNTWISAHPIMANVGIVDQNANKWFGTDFDSSISYGAIENNPNSQWTGSLWTWNDTTSTGYPGTQGFYFGAGMTRAYVSGSTCGVTLSSVPGYHQFATSTGPFVSTAQGIAFPGGFTILGAVNCDTLTTVNFLGAATSNSFSIPVDNTSQAVYSAGSGPNVSTMGYGVASNRAQFGWNSTDAAAVVLVSAANAFELMFGSTNATASRMWRWTGTALQVGSTTPVTVIDSSRDVFASGFYSGVRTVTAATDPVVATDSTIVCNAGSNPITETLPAAPTIGMHLHIIKTDATTSACTISGNGSTINGAPTRVLSAQGASVELVYVGGSQWLVMASNNTWP